MLRAKRLPPGVVAVLLLCLLVAAVPAAPAWSQETNDAAEPAPSESAPDDLVPTAPVTIDGETLFRVRGVSSYPATHRADVIADRIRELASDPEDDLTALRTVDLANETRIVYRDSMLMTLFDADAALDGVRRQTLAELYREKIATAATAYRAARTREALLGSVWRLAVGTLGAIALVLLLRRVLRTLRRRLEQRYSGRLEGVTVRNFEVVRGERIRHFIDGLARFVGLATLLGVIFVYLRYALGLFPWTRGAGDNLAAWAIAPITKMGTSLIAILPNLLFLTVLFFITRYLLRAIRVFFAAAGRGEVELERFFPEWAEPTYNLVRVLVIALAVVVAYPYIPGSDSLAFKGISVFAGIMFSLGSSSAIANVVAGYILIYRRVFSEGDVIRIGDVTGRVIKVRLQVTHVRTIKNEEVIVPNSSIVGTEVINYSTLAATDGLILHTSVGIGYETPWQQVEALLLEAASRTPGIRKEPKPFVLQTALGDFAVTHQINVYMDTATTMSRTYAALHRNVLDVFNEYGVQIMTPAYEGDPEKPKVVPPSEWYAAPAVKAPAAETAPQQTANDALAAGDAAPPRG